MSTRRVELDALRGLLLLMMALTHLPTRVSAFASQPFGFVSAAEGFVFLSAFLAGSTFSATLLSRGVEHVRNRLLTRALKLYGYHLALLLFAFTIAAAFAALTGRPALRNLLAFYFDSPTVAIVGGSLLLYQPPLFDILPMYIIFLILTPWLLATTAERGWRNVLILSLLLWTFAQLGGRRLLHEALVPLTGVHFPIEAGGSFNLFAWQLLWVGGLWIGARHDSLSARVRTLTFLVPVALAVSAFFLFWRHGMGGFSAEFSFLYSWLDKWQLGFLRLVNFAALAILAAHLVLPVLAWLHVGVLSVLGRASLQAFCAHLLICVASLGLVVDDDTRLTLPQEIIVVALTLSVMVLVARISAETAAAKRAPVGQAV